MTYTEVIKTCPFCGTPSIILVNKSAYDKWMAGECIQSAMPDASAEFRETLISGTCYSCQTNIFSDPDEDDEDSFDDDFEVEDDVYEGLREAVVDWYLH